MILRKINGEMADQKNSNCINPMILIKCCFITFQCVFHAYVPTCLACLRTHVTTYLLCLCAHVPCVPCVPTCSRAVTSNNKNKSLTVYSIA